MRLVSGAAFQFIHAAPAATGPAKDRFATMGAIRRVMETIPDYIPALWAMAVEQAENATEKHDDFDSGWKRADPVDTNFRS